jgi:HPt (histidine-containing phosphotransfer) domain-containing protein
MPPTAADLRDPDPTDLAALVDLDHRRRLADELGEEIVAELTGVFWTDADGLAAAIAAARAGDDAAGLRRNLHSLEGAATNVGYVGIAAAVAEILATRAVPGQQAIDALAAVVARTRAITTAPARDIASQQ